MKKTYIACLFAFVFSDSFAQQDSREVQGSEIEYETTDSPAFLQRADNYSLPKNGNVSELLNNKPLYSGSLRNGKLHGDWQSWYQNGLRCDSGKLIKGLPDGVWKHWDANGNLVAVRHYSADKYHSIKNEMVRYHPKRIAFPLTTLYHQNRQAALRYMHVSYSFVSAVSNNSNQTLPELIARNVVPGNPYKPVFDHVLHHGIFINYFADGKVKDSGSYKNGLRQGVWVHKDTLKKIMLQGSYANGVKVKEWKVYDSTGKLQEIMFYNLRGELKWRKRLQRSGSIPGNV